MSPCQTAGGTRLAASLKQVAKASPETMLLLSWSVTGADGGEGPLLGFCRDASWLSCCLDQYLCLFHGNPASWGSWQEGLVSAGRLHALLIQDIAGWGWPAKWKQLA